MRAETLVVRAIIPSSEDPSVHVVDGKGLYPEAEATIHTSQEVVFRQVGASVLGSYNIGINRQMNRGNYHMPDGRTLNISNILADPINPEHVELADGYEWVKVG